MTIIEDGVGNGRFKFILCKRKLMSERNANIRTISNTIIDEKFRSIRDKGRYINPNTILMRVSAKEKND